MEVAVRYTGTETEIELAELEDKTKKQRVEIDDETMKKAIQKRIVFFEDGVMERLQVIDQNGNLVERFFNKSARAWKYSEYGKIAELVAEMVRLKEIDEKNEKEREIQKQEKEKREKELKARKSEARKILADEIDAMKTKNSELVAEVKKYKEAEERRKEQAEERERQEQVRKIKAKGFQEIQWDSSKYKEVYPNDFKTDEEEEAEERISLVTRADIEFWRNRDTEETISVYSAAGTYFVF